MAPPGWRTRRRNGSRRGSPAGEVQADRAIRITHRNSTFDTPALGKTAEVCPARHVASNFSWPGTDQAERTVLRKPSMTCRSVSDCLANSDAAD